MPRASTRSFPIARAASTSRAAGNGERHDDPVADRQLRRRPGTDLDDLAHELVTEDVAFHHGGDVAVVEVEVGAADRRQRDAHDGVVRVDDLRIGDLVDAHVVHAVPDHSLH